MDQSNWMVDQDEATFTNEKWPSDKEVLVRWPLSKKEYSKWAKKTGKYELDSSFETKTYVARVLKFNGKIYNF